MDGNGRWARERKLPRLAGHRAGVDNLRRVIEACGEFGIKYLTLYAFSTENWDRPENEVRGLLNILDDVIDRELDELHEIISPDPFMRPFIDDFTELVSMYELVRGCYDRGDSSVRPLS